MWISTHMQMYIVPHRMRAGCIDTQICVDGKAVYGQYQYIASQRCASSDCRGHVAL